MKVICEATSRFWDAYVAKAGCSKEEAFRALEKVVRRRLELRDTEDVVEIREV